MHDAVAYATSTVGEPNVMDRAACTRSGIGLRAVTRVMEALMEDALVHFRREGSVPIYGLRNGIKWSYCVRHTDAGTTYVSSVEDWPARWLQMTLRPLVVGVGRVEASAPEELVERACEKPRLPEAAHGKSC
ncbi:hypothetical protein SUGI_0267070 [Cryptomeria japonica]|nr:hypothetical protein SUGI_0267070 [Cryptomeria japonica]